MSAAASRQLISFGPFEFDAASGLLYRGEREVLLPMRGGKVLETLLSRPGEVERQVTRMLATDEGPFQGGEDTSPTPLEFFLTGLVGCLTVSWRFPSAVTAMPSSVSLSALAGSRASPI